MLGGCSTAAEGADGYVEWLRFVPAAAIGDCRCKPYRIEIGRKGGATHLLTRRARGRFVRDRPLPQLCITPR